MSTKPPNDPKELLLETAPRQQSFLGKHWQKLIALAFWLILVGGHLWYIRQNGLSPLQAAQLMIDVLQGKTYGPLIYIMVYALRPLIFFSATILTLAGGFIFGPFWGVIYVVIGSNASAMVAYLVGRYFGQGMIDPEKSEGVIQNYAQRMRRNSFETVLIMRFVFLPYDLVNYLSGLLQIEWKSFILATILGSIPGTISFVLFGASIEGNFTGAAPSLNPTVLGIAALMFVASLVLSRYFKRREGSDT